MPPRCPVFLNLKISLQPFTSSLPNPLTHPHLSLSGLAYLNEIGVRQGYAVWFVVAGSSHRCSNATLIWLPDSPSLCSISPFLHDEALSLFLVGSYSRSEFRRALPPAGVVSPIKLRPWNPVHVLSSDKCVCASPSRTTHCSRSPPPSM